MEEIPKKCDALELPKDMLVKYDALQQILPGEFHGLQILKWSDCGMSQSGKDVYLCSGAFSKTFLVDKLPGFGRCVVQVCDKLKDKNDDDKTQKQIDQFKIKCKRSSIFGMVRYPHLTKTLRVDPNGKWMISEVASGVQLDFAIAHKLEINYINCIDDLLETLMFMHETLQM